MVSEMLLRLLLTFFPHSVKEHTHTHTHTHTFGWPTMFYICKESIWLVLSSVILNNKKDIVWIAMLTMYRIPAS